MGGYIFIQFPSLQIQVELHPDAESYKRKDYSAKESTNSLAVKSRKPQSDDLLLRRKI